MTKAVSAIPRGYHTVTPYLTVGDATALIDFLKGAFKAEIESMSGPDGKIMHAEARVGDSIIMIGQARGEWEPRRATLYVYVEDVDAVYKSAVEAGGISIREPADQFYGDRSGGVEDPTGNQWWIATRVEDLSMGELKERAAAAGRG